MHQPNKLQQQIIDALLKEGYTQYNLQFNDVFNLKKEGCLDINVSKINDIQDLIKTMYMCGKVDKNREIRRALDSY
jgi:hypothetical protein